MSGVGSKIDKESAKRSSSPSEGCGGEVLQSLPPLKKIRTEENNEQQYDETATGHNWYGTCETYEDMNLQESLLRGIYAYGFEKPPPIQQRAIMPCLSGRDVIVRAQSGCGKSGVYCVAVLHRIDLDATKCQALVICPTRVHAYNISSVMKSLASFMSAKIHMLTGGTSIRDDIRAMTSGVNVVVGTPGRINDMIERRSFDVSSVKMVVVEEADEILHRGFQDQLHDTFQLMPSDVQVILLSATIPPEVEEVTQRFMHNPLRIEEGRDFRRE